MSGRRLLRGPNRYGPATERNKPSVVIRLLQLLMVTAFVVMIWNASTWANSSTSQQAPVIHVSTEVPHEVKSADVQAEAHSAHVPVLVQSDEPRNNPAKAPPRRVEHDVSGGSLFSGVVPEVRVYPDPFAHDDQNQCYPDPVPEGAKKRLDMVLRADEEFPTNCEGHEELCAVVRQVAVNREVMMAVANSAAPGLAKFLDAIQHLGVPNFMIVALDKPLTQTLTKQGIPFYFSPNKAAGNHGVSAQKFSILKDFVLVGCSVLLTDTDVVYMKNPFSFLYRDADIEGMSDGWDNQTAHGWLDPIDDPSMGVDSPARHRHSYRLACMNSGLWYVHATHPAAKLMNIMSHRLATEDLWDQSGYNMELVYPSRDAFMNAGTTVRVASPFCYVNSKVMFRVIRFNQDMKDNHVPVAMHANYHVDKPKKMALVHDFYVGGNKEALDKCAQNSDGCQKGTETAAELERLHLHNINDGIISSADFRKTSTDMACAPVQPWEGIFGPMRHKLNTLPGGVVQECAGEELEALCAAAKQAALPNGDLLLVVASSANAPPAVLHLLADGLAQAHLTNVLFIPTDEATREEAAGLFPHSLDLGEVPGEWARVAVKWRVIQALLAMRFNVLAAEPDTIFFRNPFPLLFRDHDMEVQTDGWDDPTAYGLDHVVDDPKMGWSRFVHGTRVFTRDPGMAFLLPTEESLRVATRMVSRLLGLPQTPDDAEGTRVERMFFNEESFFPSHGAYTSPGAVTRVLNYFCYPNSKGFLRFYTRLMKNKLTKDTYHPVTLRLSYHSTSKCAAAMHARLKGGPSPWSAAPLFDGAEDECAPTSSREITVDSCTSIKESGPPTGELARHVVELSTAEVRGKVPAWSWGGVTKMLFLPGGELQSPWGPGKWGTVQGDPDALWVDFVGTLHLLEFESAAGTRWNMFISHRCTDANVVVGRFTHLEPQKSHHRRTLHAQ